MSMWCELMKLARCSRLVRRKDEQELLAGCAVDAVVRILRVSGVP